METIAVLGGGGTGHAIAADLTLAGFKINLFEEARFSDKLKLVSERGGIELKGAARKGFARVHKVTTDIAEALKDAKVILVAVPASRHEEIVELCAPQLRDGQTIVIGPDNAGSLVFASKLKGKKVKSKVNIAGLQGNYYPCRLVGPAEVVIALPSGKKRIAAFPAKDTAQVIKELNGIYDFVPGTNVVEVTLNSNNVVTHLPGSLLNTGAIEKQEGRPFYPYKQGMTPSVLRCVDVVRQERSALFRVLGYVDSSAEAHRQMQEKLVKLTEFPELDFFRNLAGPTSMKHRYITEDAPCGNALMVSLGEMINVPTPVTRALVILASVINQTDYLKEGRTVEKLGLSGLSVDELNRYLFEGEK